MTYYIKTSLLTVFEKYVKQISELLITRSQYMLYYIKFSSIIFMHACIRYAIFVRNK